jgi:hypothetical protein
LKALSATRQPLREAKLLDVRNVVLAYLKALVAAELDDGAVLNIAFEEARRFGEVLESLLKKSKVAVRPIFYSLGRRGRKNTLLTPKRGADTISSLSDPAPSLNLAVRACLSAASVLFKVLDCMLVGQQISRGDFIPREFFCALTTGFSDAGSRLGVVQQLQNSTRQRDRTSVRIR